jgi:dihydrofolate reductase
LEHLRLIQVLLAADLIDEITTLVIPVVLGSGKRLFEDGSRANADRIHRIGLAGTLCI